VAGLAVLGGADEALELVSRYDIDRVVFASGAPDERLLELARALNDAEIQVDLVPPLYELISPGVSIHTVEGLPLLGLPPVRLSGSSRLIKRMGDILVSAVGLILLAPLFAVIAAAVKLDSRGPVFFKQVRRGQGDTLFWLYKFRTMVVDAEERKAELLHLNKHAQEGGDPRMFKIEGDPRVTPVGRFLRRMLLDELPQLINVLKGEMSLVGPRPLILEEDQHVESWGRRRVNLKPGMTGLWQVLGRQAIPFEEMVKLDYLYVTTWSFGGDFRLLLRTIPLVVRGRGGTY
jgi:exopolysaccharide biosynthesis polyprenyl glycosylphosphotransferase